VVTPGRIDPSDPGKAETFTDKLEAQFQPVTDPSFPAVIETVDVALRSYFFSPASEPHLTKPDEVHEAIKGLPCPEFTGVTTKVSSPRYGAPWYVSNTHIHKDLVVALFADHIRALTESFDLKLADEGNPLVRQLSRYLN